MWHLYYRITTYMDFRLPMSHGRFGWHRRPLPYQMAILHRHLQPTIVTSPLLLNPPRPSHIRQAPPDDVPGLLSARHRGLDHRRVR